MYPVTGILTEHWKIDIPWNLAVHVVTKLSAQSFSTQHVCSLPGYGHSSKIKKTAMPEINTSSPALQKPRFCSGGESASYPLWKSRESWQWLIFFLFTVVVRTTQTFCASVNSVFCSQQWGSPHWAKSYQYFQCCWGLWRDISYGEWLWRSWLKTDPPLICWSSSVLDASWICMAAQNASSAEWQVLTLTGIWHAESFWLSAACSKYRP